MSREKLIERKTCHGREQLQIVENGLVWPPGEALDQIDLTLAHQREARREALQMLAVWRQTLSDWHAYRLHFHLEVQSCSTLRLVPASFANQNGKENENADHES